MQKQRFCPSWGPELYHPHMEIKSLSFWAAPLEEPEPEEDDGIFSKSQKALPSSIWAELILCCGGCCVHWGGGVVFRHIPGPYPLASGSTPRVVASKKDSRHGPWRMKSPRLKTTGLKYPDCFLFFVF